MSIMSAARGVRRRRAMAFLPQHRQSSGFNLHEQAKVSV